MPSSKLRSSLALLLVASAFVAGEAQERGREPRNAPWLARILRIEDTRRDEPAFLDSLLGHRSAEVRARAALAAGRIGGNAHVSRLRTLTADSDTAVAASSWFALAILRDTGAVSLAPSAMHAQRTAGVEAARFLGEVGEAGRPAIIAALRDSSIESGIRGAVLLAASRLRPVPAAAVVPWVSSSDSAIAWRAAYVVARGRSAAGIRALLAVARSPVVGVREQVARALTRAAAGDSLGDGAQLALHELLGDREPRVRINAVRTLAAYGSTARADVMAALRDADPGVRLVAAQSLATVLDSADAPWREAFDVDTLLAFRQAVADGAAAHGIALAGTSPWRTASDWTRRAAALSIDAHGHAFDAAVRLRGWLQDPDPRVRAAAADAITALMDSANVHGVVRAALRQALTDTDPFVRASALGGLSRGASTVDLALALDAYARGLSDSTADARLAFWQLADSALSSAGPTVPDSLVRRLVALQRPVDPLERLAAARIPRFASWADPAGTARPLAWYVARARDVSRRRRRTARIETVKGTLVLELFAWDAPLTVYNFASLANAGYFDGQRFHRVVPNFVIQAGDPRGDGNGGPGYAIRDEINRHPFGRGTLGMALSGPDTGGSQFFVAHSPQPHLDGGYTVFGQLRAGAAALDNLVQGDRIVRIVVR